MENESKFFIEIRLLVDTYAYGRYKFGKHICNDIARYLFVDRKPSFQINSYTK